MGIHGHHDLHGFARDDAGTGFVYRRGRLGAVRTGVVRPRASYWSSTRRPLPSLVFVIPLMLAYEIGVIWHTGASPAALRTGADAWMRSALGTLGLTDQWLPPLLLTVVLLSWQVMSPRDWRFSPSILGGMVIESLILAIALVGLSRLMDLGFSLLEEHPTRLLAVGSSSSRADLGSLIGFLGAGSLRGSAVPSGAGSPLVRGVATSANPAGSGQCAGGDRLGGLLFSLAHHAGTPGETFTWFAFVFRWMAGVFFAWVFVIRGFGVAVGTHTAYDILVGWIGWHL